MPLWVDLSEHQVSLNVTNSPNGKRLILRPLSPDAQIPPGIAELGFEKRGDLFERRDLQFSLPQLRKHFPKAASREFAISEIFFRSEDPPAAGRVERYQWRRNRAGGQLFGNRQELRPLTEALFAEYVKSALSPGYADTLADYRGKHPETSHCSLVQVAGAGDWRFERIGALEECRPSPKNPDWVKAVDDFFSTEATEFGSHADDAGARPQYPDERTIPGIGDVVVDVRGGFAGSPVNLRGTVIERKGALRVQITSTAGFFGETSSVPTEPLSDGWTLADEEHPYHRKLRLIGEREAQWKRDREAEAVALRARVDASKTEGFAHLDDGDPPAGTRIENIVTGQTGTIIEYFELGDAQEPVVVFDDEPAGSAGVTIGNRGYRARFRVIGAAPADTADEIRSTDLTEATPAPAETPASRAPWHVPKAQFLEESQFDLAGAAGGRVTFDGISYDSDEKSTKKAKEDVHARLVKDALYGRNSEPFAASLPTFEVMLDYPSLVYPLNQRAEKNVSRLLAQLGVGVKLLAGEDAYLKVENPPYLDLVIERHPGGAGERLYFTHYLRRGGDSILDAEMVFDIRKNGTLRLAETATQNPIRGGESRGRDVSFANMFSKNLIDQKFGDGKVLWPRDELQEELDPAPAASAPPLDPTSPEGYALVMADNALLFQHQDTLNAFLGQRADDIRNALHERGWEVAEAPGILKKTEDGIIASAAIDTIGVGWNIAALVGKVYTRQSGVIQTFPDDLSRTPEQLAEQIDQAAFKPALSSAAMPVDLYAAELSSLWVSHGKEALPDLARQRATEFFAAIEARDADELIARLAPSQSPISRIWFEKTTGVALGRTLQETCEAIRTWAAGDQAEATAGDAAPEGKPLTPYEFGKRAFSLGIKAPVLDAEFMKTLTPNGNIERLKEWTRGWTEMHVASTPSAQELTAPAQEEKVKVYGAPDSPEIVAARKALLAIAMRNHLTEKGARQYADDAQRDELSGSQRSLGTPELVAAADRLRDAYTANVTLAEELARTLNAELAAESSEPTDPAFRPRPLSDSIMLVATDRTLEIRSLDKGPSQVVTIQRLGTDQYQARQGSAASLPAPLLSAVQWASNRIEDQLAAERVIREKAERAQREMQEQRRELRCFTDGFRQFLPAGAPLDRDALLLAVQELAADAGECKLPDGAAMQLVGDATLRVTAAGYSCDIIGAEPAPAFCDDRPWIQRNYMRQAPASFVSALSIAGTWLRENLAWEEKKASYPDGGDLVESLACQYAAFLHESMPTNHDGGVREMHRSFAAAIADKNADYLIGWIARSRGQNELSKKFFTKATGHKLPATIRDITATLYAWAGFTPEQAAQREAEKEAAHEARQQARRLDNEIRWSGDDLSSFRVNHDGEIKTAKQFMDEILAQGYTDIRKNKVGAVDRYSIVNPEIHRSYLIKGKMVSYAKAVLEKRARDAQALSLTEMQEEEPQLTLRP